MPGCKVIQIGERINTIRKAVLRAYEQKNHDYLAQETVRQAQMGADVIDVNAGTDIDIEPANMAWALQVVQDVVDLPIVHLQFEPPDDYSRFRCLSGQKAGLGQFDYSG